MSTMFGIDGGLVHGRQPPPNAMPKPASAKRASAQCASEPQGDARSASLPARLRPVRL